MKANETTSEQIKQLCEWYGDGLNGSCPTLDQWQRTLDRPAGGPLTLINFFKLRELASYTPGTDDTAGKVTGEQAFNRYASVSIPTMQRIGGNFLLVGSVDGTFLGNDEDWDVVAIGSYPDVEAFLGLYTDADYRAAFRHRSAACERQKVLVCTAQSGS